MSRSSLSKVDQVIAIWMVADISSTKAKIAQSIAVTPVERNVITPGIEDR